MTEFIPRPQGLIKPVEPKPEPKRGTEQWEKEHQESQNSVETYFTYVVGPPDPNAGDTIQVHIDPKSGLVEPILPADQQPIPDDTGLFQPKGKK